MTRPLPLSDLLGHGLSDKRIDILRRIADAGSISEAARAAGVSYKAAWQAVETLTNLAGTPLLDKAVGGRGGGGATLTPSGQRVLQAAQRLAVARREALRAWDQGELGATGRAALALQTSMRNQIPCQVLRLQAGQGMVLVQLQTPGGVCLAARITRESSQLLGLHRGQPVLALFKATAVQVGTTGPAGTAAAPAGEVNLLDGVVSRRSGASAEVTLQLADGLSVVGFAPSAQCLRRGQAVQARFEASAVVIAIGG